MQNWAGKKINLSVLVLEEGILQYAYLGWLYIRAILVALAEPPIIFHPRGAKLAKRGQSMARVRV